MEIKYIISLIFLVIMTIAMICYDRINHKKGYKFYVALKMLASITFVLAGWSGFFYLSITNQKMDGFKYLILLGGLCGFIGDFLLSLVSYKGEKMFTIGVGAFFVNQLLFIIAIAFIVPLTLLDIAVTACIIIIIGILMKILKIKINKNMFIPIGLYIGAISLVLSKAISLFYCMGNIELYRISLSVGVVLFVISDFVLGINKFAKHYKALDTVNTYTYFPGQLLVALAIIL